jgi:hypothetical protein
MTRTLSQRKVIDVFKKYEITIAAPVHVLINALHEFWLYPPAGLAWDAKGLVISTKDQITWKEAREKLAELAEHTGKTLELLYTLMRNDDHSVAWSALMHHDESLTLGGFIQEGTRLEEAATLASEMPGKIGNRPAPFWHKEAARLCTEFWREQKGEDPKSRFRAEKRPGKNSGKHHNDITEPQNAFSKWFCDLMVVLYGWTPSQCETALRKEPNGAQLNAPQE